MALKKPKTFRVLAVDQWTSTGNVAGTKFKDWKTDISGARSRVAGGDSEAIGQILGVNSMIMKVGEADKPRLGSVWFRPNKRGILVLWKANYDSSD